MGVVPCRILRRSVAAVKLLTRRFAALCVAAAVLLAGCATIPADPDGTLDRVRADGGLTAKSPWADKVALTRPHATSEFDGGKVEHVLAVPLGENALLFALESWVDGRAA